MQLSIESVLRLHLSEVEEYEVEEGEEESERVYRTLTIATASGILEIELSAATAANLDPVVDV